MHTYLALAAVPPPAFVVIVKMKINGVGCSTFSNLQGDCISTVKEHNASGINPSQGFVILQPLLSTLTASVSSANSSSSIDSHTSCHLRHEAPRNSSRCGVHRRGAARGIGDGGDHVGGGWLRHLPDGAVHGGRQERQSGAVPTVLRQHRQHGRGGGGSQVPVLSAEQSAGHVQRGGAQHRPRPPQQVPHRCAQGLRLPRNPSAWKLNEFDANPSTYVGTSNNI